jgi:2-phosphosulfolactate phosphatase
MKVEVCFSPALFPYFEKPEAVVVIIDILRASSAIVAAFENGVDRIIPVGTLEEAKEYKRQGYMVAAERDGLVQDFADFGNSPFNFTPQAVKGKQIVYSTTNGTQAIQMARTCHAVVVGAYLNFTALVNWLRDQQRDVIILCAAWKNKFSLEDSVFAGAVVHQLLELGHFNTDCDSAIASRDLYLLARKDLLAYMENAAQRHRLKKNNLDDVIGYCHTFDLATIIPILQGDALIAYHS